MLSNPENKASICEITLFLVGLKDMMSSMVDLGSLLGNCGRTVLISSLIWKYINKWELGKLKFLDKETNVLSIKRSLKHFRPLRCHLLKAVSSVQSGRQ